MNEVLAKGYRQFGNYKSPTVNRLGLNGAEEDDFANSLDPALINLQKAAFGCIDGFSFANQGVSQCVVGIRGVLFNGFQALQFADIYIPSNTFKFTKFSNNLN
jgi:hypothetical protein